MKRNFHLEENAVEIVVDEQTYDLHNCFDFTELKIETHTCTVSLVFKGNSEFGGSPFHGKRVEIKFYGVDYFELSPCFMSEITPDVEELGYKSPGDRDMDWLANEGQSSPEDHLVVRLVNDEFVRIHSRWAVAYEFVKTGRKPD